MFEMGNQGAHQITPRTERTPTDGGKRQTRPDGGRLAVDQLGDDLESRVPNSGRLRFIEVKGRDAGAVTVTVRRNDILYSLNKRRTSSSPSSNSSPTTATACVSCGSRSTASRTLT